MDNGDQLFERLSRKSFTVLNLGYFYGSIHTTTFSPEKCINSETDTPAVHNTPEVSAKTGKFGNAAGPILV